VAPSSRFRSQQKLDLVLVPQHEVEVLATNERSRVMGAESIQASSSWFTKSSKQKAIVHLRSRRFSTIHRRC
jgi:hypothetical protein